RGVRVHQDDRDALLAERLAGLRPGVVELAALADDDRAGADDQDLLEVGALGHSPPIVPGADRAFNSGRAGAAALPQHSVRARHPVGGEEVHARRLAALVARGDEAERIVLPEERAGVALLDR